MKNRFYLILITILLIISPIYYWPVFAIDLLNTRAKVTWGNNDRSESKIAGYMMIIDQSKLASFIFKYYPNHPALTEAGCKSRVNANPNSGNADFAGYYQFENRSDGTVKNDQLLYGIASLSWSDDPTDPNTQSCDYGYIYLPLSSAKAQALIEGDIYSAGRIRNADPNNPYLAVLGKHIVIAEKGIYGPDLTNPKKSNPLLETASITSLGTYLLNANSTSQIDIAKFKSDINNIAKEHAINLPDNDPSDGYTDFFTAMETKTPASKPTGDVYVYNGRLDINKSFVIPTGSKKLVIVKNGDLNIYRNIGNDIRVRNTITDISSGNLYGADGVEDGKVVFVVLDGNINVTGFQATIQGPVAHWKFNETSWNGSANQIKNSISANYEGQAVGGTLGGQPGVFLTPNTYAGTFDGQNDGINIDNTPNLNTLLTGSFTYSFWVKLKGDPQGTYPHLVGPTGTHVYPGIRYYKVNKKVYMEWGFSPCDGKSGSFTTLWSNTLDNNWHNIAYVYDKSTSTLRNYFDGSPVGDPKNAVFCPNISSTFNIGNGFNGSLDDVRVYNQALTQQQINENMLTESSSITQEFDASIVNAGLISLKETSGWNGEIRFDHAPNCNEGCRTLSIQGLVMGGKIFFNRLPSRIPASNYGTYIYYDKKVGQLPGLSNLVKPKLNEISP